MMIYYMLFLAILANLGVLSLQPAFWHPSPGKPFRLVRTLVRGAKLPAGGIIPCRKAASVRCKPKLISYSCILIQLTPHHVSVRDVCFVSVATDNLTFALGRKILLTPTPVPGPPHRHCRHRVLLLCPPHDQSALLLAKIATKDLRS